jgi:hypothetical protein
MDYRDYKQTYQQLLTQSGREEIGNDTNNTQAIEAKINTFLEKYPSIIPPDKNPETPFYLLSLKAVFNRTILVAIDIINDVADVLSQQSVLGSTVTRRKIVEAFTKPERRVYFGIWLIFFAVVFFFLDGSS